MKSKQAKYSYLMYDDDHVIQQEIITAIDTECVPSSLIGLSLAGNYIRDGQVQSI